jgi:hypothetical protein
MVELVLIFCLAGTGASCKSVRPRYEPPYPSMQACFLEAEQVATRELSDRLDLQGYRLAGWRCVQGGSAGTPT